MLMLALPSNLPLTFAILSLMAGSAGVAIADVTIDACVTENSISHPSLAGDMQSLCGVSSSTGALVGFLISDFFLHIIGPKISFGGVVSMLSHCELGCCNVEIDRCGADATVCIVVAHWVVWCVNVVCFEDVEVMLLEWIAIYLPRCFNDSWDGKSVLIGCSERRKNQIHMILSLLLIFVMLLLCCGVAEAYCDVDVARVLVEGIIWNAWLCSTSVVAICYFAVFLLSALHGGCAKGLVQVLSDGGLLQGHCTEGSWNS